MKKLKKGDLVVMHSCVEANEYEGKIWECLTNEEEGKVFLIEFSGTFYTKYLQKVCRKSILHFANMYL